MLKLTTENIDTTLSNGISLVKFGATWCGPCKMMDRILVKIAEGYVSQPNVKFCLVDIDESPEIAKHYGISSVPTMIFVKDGIRSDPFVGIKAEKDIIHMIESMK